MTTLVFDCGSTKATVAIIKSHIESITYVNLRHGLNAVTTTEGELSALISTESRLMRESEYTKDIFFYGAGCAGAEACGRVSSELGRHFKQAGIHVHSDMLGAARALCGHDPGIVGILGTGSNSCLYNGNDITANVSPLGYILGDEGSGAVLGRLFLGRVLKRQFSRDILEAFNNKYHLTPAEAVQRVYREPRPNAFLASFAPFIASQCDKTEMRDFVISEFRRYILYNLKNYDGFTSLPVHFVGSIALHFASQLEEAMRLEHGHLGTITSAPIQLLAKYHQS